MLKILVSSAGSLVGQNIVEVLARRRDQVQLVGTNCLAHEPVLFRFDKVYLVPETLDPEFEARFLEVLQSEKPDIVLAGRDDDVVFLANLAEKRPDLAPSILGQGKQAAEMMSDKWLSYQFSQKYNLPFIPSLVSSNVSELSLFAEKHGFPLLAKPRAGYASKGIYLPSNLDELLRIAGEEGYMLQKYWGNLDGFETYQASLKEYGAPLFHTFEEPKYSIQTLIHKEGSWEPIFYSRHTMKYGLSFGVEKIEDQDLTNIGESCCAALKQVGWSGPINIQAQKNAQGELAIIEFNGRLTGATAARYYIGYDEVGLAVSALSQKNFSRLENTNNVVQSVTKKLTCFSTEIQKIEMLNQTGSWQADQ